MSELDKKTGGNKQKQQRVNLVFKNIKEACTCLYGERLKTSKT